jgi:hypothetical protein
MRSVIELLLSCPSPCLFIKTQAIALTRSTDLDKVLLRHLLRLGHRDHQLTLLDIPRCSPCQVGLVLLSLSVGKVGTFVGVKREAESAFERAKVGSEDVGVLKDNRRRM